MKIKIAKYTDAGGRKVNEDFLVTVRNGQSVLCAVADGLGGHGMGDEASRLVCSVAEDKFLKAGRPGESLLEDIFLEGHAALIEKQKQLHASGKMRTTLNLWLTDGEKAFWGHIGDSRTYYFKDKQLCRRTFDHSVPQMLCAAGQIKESEIRFHEDRNRLLRVLGVEDRAPAFENEEPVTLSGGEQFLLCSDGFWELISEEQMLLCLDEAEEPGLWLDNMTELVSRNSRNRSTDNITAVALWVYP